MASTKVDERADLMAVKMDSHWVDKMVSLKDVTLVHKTDSTKAEMWVVERVDSTVVRMELL